MMKMAKRALFIAIITLLILTFVGCDTESGNYPNDKAIQWYCEEIDMTVRFQTKEDKGTYNGSPWEWNGETYNVHVGFLASTAYFGADLGKGGLEDLWSSTWEYDGDNFVVTIKVDENDIFGGTISKLVFVPQ